jgi:mRNA deadenylase 3'-5' endonuclease subunit Ccr4
VNFKLVVKKGKKCIICIICWEQNAKPQKKNLCICHSNFVFKQPFYKHNNLKLQTHVSNKLIIINNTTQLKTLMIIILNNTNQSWAWFCCNPSLGLATKARACKCVSQEGSPGGTFYALGSAKECEGMNPHIPKGTLTLWVRVPVDS